MFRLPLATGDEHNDRKIFTRTKRPLAMNRLPPDCQHAPATTRNREPLLTVLREFLPPAGTVLEVASGSGEHATFFAPQLAPRYWLPSDIDERALASITAWQALTPAAHLLPPIRLDVRESIWIPEQSKPPQAITAIVAVNMIHIAAWEACLGLMAGAGRLLAAGGVVVLYGPFRQSGQHTAASNAAFDDSLRRRNGEWGVRDLEDVVSVAEAEGFSLGKTVTMPANNLSVIFMRH
jgi:hypothetical protein